MRIFFSVGEPSGDLHGANLVRCLQSRADVECVGFGGPRMKQAGCELLFDLTSMAVMFIGEVLKNLRFFFRLVDQADDYFANHQVDAVVLIDYPGFNWWIARKAKRRGIPVFYYGVPQVWAWAPWRLRKIRKLVDHVLCKLPFEESWFAERDCNATYVGHPYFDELSQQVVDPVLVEEWSQSPQGQAEGPLLTLLPGSRDSEVRNVLPILLQVAAKVRKQVPDVRIKIASFNERQQGMAKALAADSQIEVCVQQTPELIRAADVCVACSGSVSLELMHYRKPTVVVFKVARWAMLAQALLLRSKFITLVNLLDTRDIRKRTWKPFDPDAAGAEDAVMPEYLTTGDPSDRIAARLIEWLTNTRARENRIDRLDRLAKQYALPGATQRAANYIFDQLGAEPKWLEQVGLREEPRRQRA